jgi:hypothetical protein
MPWLVIEGEPDVFTRAGIRDAPRGVYIKCDVMGLDRERATIGHGVPRVDRKVEDRIVDVAGIGYGLTRVGRQSQRDGHLVAERSPQQLNCARDAIIECAGATGGVGDAPAFPPRCA